MGAYLCWQPEKWSDSPYINHFLQPDTIIPNRSNPQNWNRYSYVQNRPINFNDPTGHYSAECAGTEEDCKNKPPAPAPAPQSPSLPAVIPSSGEDDYRCQNDPDCFLNTSEDLSETYEPDFSWSVGNKECDADCQKTVEALFVFGWMMDSIATGVNLAFALTYNIFSVMGPKWELIALAGYKQLSIIPNLIGSAGGVAWIVSGFLSGDNYLEITRTDSVYHVSGSIAQDTIATVIFDGGGWIAPYAQKPNGAFINSALGVIYDMARNPFDPMLPTFFQPTFSFSFDTN